MSCSSCQGELVVRRVAHPAYRPTHLDAVCLDCGAWFWTHLTLLFQRLKWTSAATKYDCPVWLMTSKVKAK
jgi:hypothetical protein